MFIVLEVFLSFGNGAGGGNTCGGEGFGFVLSGVQ
jgi:hypothetical protein